MKSKHLTTKQMRKKLLLISIGFALSIQTILAQIPSYIPVDGLDSYWGFGDTTNDYTTNGNNGTIIGSSSFVNDRYGNANSAFGFASSGDIICTTNSYNNIKIFSVSLWFKTQNQGFLFGSDNGKCTHSNLWDRYIYIKPNGNVEFYVFNGSQKYCTAFGNYKDNVWHNVVSVLSSAGMQVYIDGVLLAENNSVTSAQNYIGYWRVGGLQLGGNNTIIGNIDDIGLWSRVLTPNEISTIYQQGLLNVNQQVHSKFNIYPNPVIDKIKIEINESNFDSDYKIIDQTGKEILTGKLTGKSSIIDVNSLSKGFYILCIKSDLNKSFKFIKY